MKATQTVRRMYLDAVVGLDETWGADQNGDIWMRYAATRIATYCQICFSRISTGWANLTTGETVCSDHVRIREFYG